MLTWLVCHGGDTELAESTTVGLSHLSPFMESQFPGQTSGVEEAKTQSPPRVLKTHLPEWCFTDTFTKCHPKVIVVMRDPKDIIVSFYHMYKKVKLLGPFTGSFDEYFELFKNKELTYGDVFEYNLGWWKHRGDKRYLFLRYEDMKQDVKPAIRQIADLCDVTLNLDQVDRIAQYCEFDNMSRSTPVKLNLDEINVPVDHFMRKGQVGDWKTMMSPSQREYVDKLCKERFTPVGIDYPCN